MKNILIILIILNLCSCDLFHLVGVKERKNENPKEVNNFIKKKSYLYDKSVLMDDSLRWMRETDDYIFSDLSGIASAIELRIFDSIGNYYTSFSTCHGDFDEKGYLPGIPIPKNTQQEYLNQSLSLKKELILIDLDDFEKEKIKLETKKYRYTIVVYYTIWTNHFSKRVLKEVSNLKKRYPNQVYVILSNVATDIDK